MKVHYIKTDNLLFVFGIVDKKRKDFNGDNVACVRGFDIKDDYSQFSHMDLGCDEMVDGYVLESGIMNIETARRGWDEFVARAEEADCGMITHESIYKRMNGSSILTDSEIAEAMDDICRKQIWRMKNPYSKENKKQDK